eukprot:6129485-Karenia_brevis.AAC.1
MLTESAGSEARKNECCDGCLEQAERAKSTSSKRDDECHSDESDAEGSELEEESKDKELELEDW